MVNFRDLCQHPRNICFTSNPSDPELLYIDLNLRVASVGDLLLELPEELMGQPTTEWRCKDRAVHSVAKAPFNGRWRVGLHFDCLGVPRR
jgi:hypothetical protein